MDSLVIKEKNQVIDMRKDGKMLKSTIFMRSMKVIILMIGTTYCNDRFEKTAGTSDPVMIAI